MMETIDADARFLFSTRVLSGRLFMYIFYYEVVWYVCKVARSVFNGQIAHTSILRV